jgi:UDP-3-O-[3-hydroxymyristoyl] N-acetylglucosamine deacetylase
MRNKQTIAREVTLSGTGIHSGTPVTMCLLPSTIGEIAFRRTDLDGLEFRIEPEKLTARNSTNLIRGEHRILTLEHLMAALYAFGIDSALIELDGEEIPILDGSACPFAEALEAAGVQELDDPLERILIQEAFILEEGEASLRVTPSDSFVISYRIEFDHPAIGVQELSLKVDLEGFVSGIAPARTFGFLKDVPALWAQQLALGGSLENALVLDEEKLINGPLRFPDEFVRHKILDLVGDLSILGRPVCGRFSANRAGHGLHLRAVRFLLENPQMWIAG